MEKKRFKTKKRLEGIGSMFHLLMAAIFVFVQISGSAGALETVYAAEELTGQTASQITSQMGMGWNLGNTFDATGGNASDIYSQEQSWGNPKVTKTLIDGVKKAGFQTIRIPVTWNRFISKDGSYTIDKDFLARVKTIVDYAYADNMFVILNVHHEEWVNVSNLDTAYIEVGKELTAVWKQLAEYFADYDQHLIFEGMNEPRKVGTSIEWTGNEASYQAVNYLNQVFVSTVRSVALGHNAERCLMIPGYAASSQSSIMNAITIPTFNGTAAKNLIVSVHCYSPHDFCLSDKEENFSASSESSVSEIDNIFKNIDEIFLQNGIPVVIGETSATNKNNTSAREAWAKYMGQKSQGYGVPIVLWDNGVNKASGGECHSYINRNTGEQVYPTIISALKSGISSKKWAQDRTAKAQGNTSSITGGSVIWSDASGLTNQKLWDSNYIVTEAKSAYYLEGREIAVAYTGNGTPLLVLDSASKQVWWIPVNPTRTGKIGNKNVAYYSSADIQTALKSKGITNTADLRNMSICATNADITTYEIAVTGNASVTYMANGAVYSVGTKLPADPSAENMVFAGWYKTKDYQKGTEYTGEKVTEDTIVYAKFTLKNGIIAVSSDLPFTDIYMGTWQHDVAKYVYENKIIMGTSKTTFSPSAKMTRGMLVTILWRIDGAKEVNGDSFSDVSDKAYYAQGVKWAKKTGVVYGYTNGKFGPEDIVTREQFIAILYRFAEYKKLAKPVTGSTYKQCSDYAKVSDWAVSCIEWGYQNKLIGASGKLDPKSGTSRIEAAAMIKRFLEKFEIKNK